MTDVPTDPEITELLDDWSRGDPAALERLMPLIVDDLRRIARRFLRREGPGHTLQPTALVNEAYLRIAGRRSVEWRNRSQFFAVMAGLMRHVLVEHARGKQAVKRGRGIVKLSLQDVDDLALVKDPDLVVVDDALKGLEALDPRQSKIVELKFFGGLTIEEIAEVLEISTSTVKREWNTAKLWLLDEIVSSNRDPEDQSR